MNSSKRYLSSLLILTLLFTPALAQQSAQPEKSPATLAELQTRIDSLIDQPKFAAARWGIKIITADGKLVYERDSGKSFTPASNMKLYTSSAALDAFGPDFKIKTSVYATKPVKGGVIRGDLIFYGRGDPNISSRFDPQNRENPGEIKPSDRITAIEQIADRIKARGIKTITGNLIGDDSYFAGDLLGYGWQWDNAQFYYSAELSALTVNDNAVSFTITPGHKAGHKPTIKIQPINGYIKIINNADTVAGGTTKIGVNRPLNSDTVEFFGSIPRGAKEFEIQITVHNPAAFAASLLKDALARRNIRVRGRAQSIDAIARVSKPFDESKLIEVADIESQPMSEMLKVINKESQNLHTELMLHQLGVRHPDYGTLDEYDRPKSTAVFGAEMLRRFLQRAGVDTQPLSLRDGSGLTRHDLITPASTSRLLEFMLTHPHFSVFWESLPIAGVDGTLERRMRDTAAMNNFRGKTGTLSYVNALSGYITTKQGQMLIVSMMGNNYVGPGRDVTGVMDQICVLLTGIDPLERDAR